MCKERKRTRDLLLEYNSHIMPPKPRTAGLGMVYPWENAPISSLIKQLFIIASNSGFTGTENDFKINLGAYLQNKPIIFDLLENFPSTGLTSFLYFDLNGKILYYWDNEYKPVNSLFIENLVFDAGTSTISVED